MKKLLLLLFSLMFSFSSNAEITSFDERFSLLCEAEQSTGFRWRDDAWKKMNWTLPKYIITKQDYEPSSDWDEAKHYMCSRNKKGDFHNESSNKIFMDSCYLIKNFGEEETESNYQTCREEWTAELPFTLNKVHCSEANDPQGIIFKPNGWFTKYGVADQVANIPKPIYINDKVIVEAGVKDDMLLYVGRCSTF